MASGCRIAGATRDRSRRVALAGGGERLRALAAASRVLKDGSRFSPELVLLTSRGELRDYAAASDLQPLVDLADHLGWGPGVFRALTPP